MRCPLFRSSLRTYKQEPIGAPLHEEGEMNREFQPTSSFTRGVIAAIATVVTLSIAGFIDGLATHYTSIGEQMADQTVVSARV